MARSFALFLALVALLAFAACGGDDDDTASPTAATQDSEDTTGSPSASDDASATPLAEWTAEFSGHLTGEITSKLNPQCILTGGRYAVILQGLVDGDSAVITILSQGAGTFDLTEPADEAPSVDVATSGDDPNEWLVTAGEATEGALTIEVDNSGTVSATLPPITAGDVDDLTLTASWTCPEQ